MTARSFLLALLAAALAACNTPTPSMWRGGVDAGVTRVDGADWRVWRKGLRAEAHRLNFDVRFARAAMVARGAVAIERLTGCAIRRGSLEGDQAIVRARLRCGGDSRPLPDAAPREVACVLPGRKPIAGDRAPEVVMTDCVVER